MTRVNCEVELEFELEFKQGVYVVDTGNSSQEGRCYPSLQGRLRKHSQFWLQELQPSKVVADIVTEGYRLPLFSRPPPICFRNHSSARREEGFVENAVQELLRSRCAMGVQRLVMDLRYLNQFLWKDKFRYEDIKAAIQLFEPGDYAITFDLKSGYHHVDMHPESWTYLGFTWKQKYMSFGCCRFGLAPAPYMFTKLLRPLVRRWRIRGLRVVLYVDDGICVAQTVPQAGKAAQCSYTGGSSGSGIHCK